MFTREKKACSCKAIAFERSFGLVARCSHLLLCTRRLSMTATLHIRLLGEFSLASGETPLTGVDWPRLQSLLAYLVLHHNAPQSRTHLASLLWLDSTETQAHSNLRTLLFRLRQALPHASSFLHIEKQTLRWEPQHPGVSWTLDVLDFEHVVAQVQQA